MIDSAGSPVGIVTQTDLLRGHKRALCSERDALEETVAMRTAELQNAPEHVHALSLEDALLSIGNRRALELDLIHTHATAERYGRRYSVALFDVDHFKTWNDRHGHLAGDETLRQVTPTLLSQLRAADRLYRYGGDELLLLLPETQLEGAHTLAQRMVEAIAAAEIDAAGSDEAPLTLSAGVSSIAPGASETWERVPERADSALDRAKQADRNRAMSEPGPRPQRCVICWPAFHWRGDGMVERSLTARSALILGCTALGGLGVGIGGIQIGVLDPFSGFRIAAGLGLIFGLFSLLAAAVAFYRTRRGSSRTGRANAWMAMILGAISLAALLVPALQSGKYPPIHDVTTNPDDPPAFSDEIARAPDRRNGVLYPDPNPQVTEMQRAAFPDLAPIELDLPPPEALDRARDVALSLGWEVAHTDSAAFRIEATHTSRIFRFVDDIVIRVRPDSRGGSTIDLRSNSRVGGGDLGANALRIRAFRDAIHHR